MSEVLLCNTESLFVSTDLFNEAEQLTQWIFSTIQPFLKGRILEIGSGSGKLAESFIQNDIGLHLSDPKGANCRLLQKKFEGKQSIKAIHQIKLAQEDFDAFYERFLRQFDTVIIVNTVEHVPNGQKAFSNAKKLLRSDGICIALMPARTALYNQSEFGLREWKRQNRRNLRSLMGKDLETIKTQYFQVVSIVRWLISRRHTKAGELEESAPNRYAQEVPVFRIADEILFHKLGLSLITIKKIKNSHRTNQSE